MNFVVDVHMRGKFIMAYTVLLQWCDQSEKRKIMQKGVHAR